MLTAPYRYIIAICTSLIVTMSAHAACPPGDTWAYDDLEAAELAYANIDEDGLSAVATALGQELSCVTRVVTPEEAAAIHQAEGLRAFLANELDDAQACFARSNGLQPKRPLPADIAPAGSRLATLLAAATSSPSMETGRLALGPGLTSYVDGWKGAYFPAHGPYVLQITDAGGAVLWSGYIRFGADPPDLNALSSAGAAAATGPPTALEPSPWDDAAASPPITGLPSGPSKLAAVLADAERAFKAGDFPHALRFTRTAEDLAPTEPQPVSTEELSRIYLLRAAILLAKGEEEDKALDQLRSALVLSSQTSYDPALFPSEDWEAILEALRGEVTSRAHVPAEALAQSKIFVDGASMEAEDASPILEGRHLLQMACQDGLYHGAWADLPAPSLPPICDGGPVVEIPRTDTSNGEQADRTSERRWDILVGLGLPSQVRFDVVPDRGRHWNTGLATEFYADRVVAFSAIVGRRIALDGDLGVELAAGPAMYMNGALLQPQSDGALYAQVSSSLDYQPGQGHLHVFLGGGVTEGALYRWVWPRAEVAWAW